MNNQNSMAIVVEKTNYAVNKRIFRVPSHEDLICVSTSIVHFSPVPQQLKLFIPLLSTVYSFVSADEDMPLFERYNSAVAQSIYSIGVFTASYGLYAYSPPIALSVSFAELFLSSDIKNGLKEPVISIIGAASYPLTAASMGLIGAMQELYSKYSDAPESDAEL